MSFPKVLSGRQTSKDSPRYYSNTAFLDGEVIVCSPAQCERRRQRPHTTVVVVHPPSFPDNLVFSLVEAMEFLFWSKRRDKPS